MPIEETVGAMAELVEAGKVAPPRAVGGLAPPPSGAPTPSHPITALQTEYSLWTRDVEDEILPTLRELGIGLVPYSPLGRGFLTGAITSPDDLDADDFRRTPTSRASRARPSTATWPSSRAVREIADAKGVTAGQLALAWVLAQGDDVVPIPGTKRVRYLEENVGAASRAADRRGPGRARRSRAARGRGVGDRYGDMSSIDA